MRICYLTSYYPPFIDAICKKHGYFAQLNYEQSLELVLNEYYADTGAIVHYSRKFGNDAKLIIQNFEIFQKKWAGENNVSFSDSDWQEKIVIEQIRKWQSEVFYTESISNHNAFF